ncbi:MAG: Viral (Superfamily 1) helicase [Polaromonas sp.]|nr:Viral (Superfamily 1) helicase [Polaromonas sp.]
MPTHITARLAWHDDGWDGTICRRPELNTYCVGAKSYPGDVIARDRDLAMEQSCAGCSGSALPANYVPPCCYSYNAFGLQEAAASSSPPDFFLGGAERRDWTLPPATVCVWPYEAMYADEVSAGGFLDNDKRRALTQKYFDSIETDVGRNLVFYYANFSNPLSEENAPRYVLIGVSRIAKIGEELLYDNVNDVIAKKYAGGMVWARNITANYPEEGLRLPYHLYRDDPEKMRDLAVFPESPSLCKYGSKHLSDDDAIGLLEQFLAKVRLLLEFGDVSEDWRVRETWLLKTIADLWMHRGLYPGLLRALEAAGLEPLIEPTKAACLRHGHQSAHKLAFAALTGGISNELTTGLTDQSRQKMQRSWKLLGGGAQTLLRDVLPRLDLAAAKMKAIAADERATCGLPDDSAAIVTNPYIIAEYFADTTTADGIAWSVVDRGVLPPADIGPSYADIALDDARRFRSLCIDHLRAEPNHTFRFGETLIAEIATRIDRLPEWKRATFNLRYFEADEEFLSESLTLKPTEHGLAVYLRTIFEDERSLERAFRELAGRPDIALKRPVTQDDWHGWVYKSDSVLSIKGGKDYEEATAEQASICAALFRRPLSVVTGSAGTGKTTVIEALVRAVRRTEGDGASILVLAPTGKAADRAREVFSTAALTGVQTITVHSFLASSGWLNKNLTFKRSGGKRIAVGTLMLDEASMLDLALAAALFRAIDWSQVRRLVLVGDAGQLPPIGRGRVLADVIGWLEAGQHESLGRLRRNLRQMLNKVEGKGCGIVALAELFIVDAYEKEPGASSDAHDLPTRLDQEELIERLHAGGAVDQDLDVIYWNEPTELAGIMIAAVESRMAGGAILTDQAPYKIWRAALKDDPTAFQILTPHRGEMHGVEALNEACQNRIAKGVIDRVGAVDGITLFDKVIQIRNRPKSNMIWAYDEKTKTNVEVEVFNGEIGVVGTFGFDDKVRKRLMTGYGPRLTRFNVQFARKPNLTVGYGKGVPTGGKFPRTEKVEDNLELAYTVSVHKAQGSEFAQTFVVIPAIKGRSLSPELVYTALTRASRHCTLLIERDVGSLLEARRRENAQTPQISSSLFRLRVPKPLLLQRSGWYEAGKIHEALSGDMVRSKSEVIIANLLHQNETPFFYEMMLLADDGTMRLPDFTVVVRGEKYFWEHLGLLDQTKYAREWDLKRSWYERWFPGRLVVTLEGAKLSHDAKKLVDGLRSGDLDVIDAFAPPPEGPVAE